MPIRRTEGSEERGNADRQCRHQGKGSQADCHGEAFQQSSIVILWAGMDAHTWLVADTVRYYIGSRILYRSG